MMQLPKIAYLMLGIPVEYHGMTYTDTKLPAVRISSFEDKISKAPNKGILLISGTAAPVVNQLMNTRKVVGLSFVEYYESKLSAEETMSIPKGQVVIIYGVGAEPANNSQFAGKLLGALLSSYKSSLVIIETDRTASNFQTTYGVVIANTLSIPEKEIERWV